MIRDVSRRESLRPLAAVRPSPAVIQTFNFQRSYSGSPEKIEIRNKQHVHGNSPPFWHSRPWSISCRAAKYSRISCTTDLPATARIRHVHLWSMSAKASCFLYLVFKLRFLQLDTFLSTIIILRSKHVSHIKLNSFVSFLLRTTSLSTS